MFFATKYHLIGSYAIVECKKVPFTIEEINTLYGLSKNSNEYPGQGIIFKRTDVDIKRVLKTITWLGTNWEEMLTGKLQLYPYQLTIEKNV